MRAAIAPAAVFLLAAVLTPSQLQCRRSPTRKDNPVRPALPQDAGAPVDGVGIGYASDASGNAGAETDWAMWPMPNAPSSGLPHAQSYDTSVTGTAIDGVTGLMWQRDARTISTAPSAQGVVEQAMAYCAGLGLANLHDWRLPSRIELVSLLDFTRDPAEDTSVFSVPTGFLVSSSVHPTIVGRVVGVAVTGDGTNATTGGSVVYLQESVGSVFQPDGSLQGPDSARCVRGHITRTEPHYQIGSETVRDNWTGLTWLKSPSNLMIPSAVGSYCASRNHAGAGWRSPSVNELQTLWGDDPAAVGATVDPAAFAALRPAEMRLSSSDFEIGGSGATSPTQWLHVTGRGEVRGQQDVLVGIPSPATWIHALCVSTTSH